MEDDGWVQLVIRKSLCIEPIVCALSGVWLARDRVCREQPLVGQQISPVFDTEKSRAWIHQQPDAALHRHRWRNLLLELTYLWSLLFDMHHYRLSINVLTFEAAYREEKNPLRWTVLVNKQKKYWRPRVKMV
jgi:hypothetical protein